MNSFSFAANIQAVDEDFEYTPYTSDEETLVSPVQDIKREPRSSSSLNSSATLFQQQKQQPQRKSCEPRLFTNQRRLTKAERKVLEASFVCAAETGDAAAVAYCLHRQDEHALSRMFGMSIPKTTRNLSSKISTLAMHKAAIHGHASIVQLLLAYGVSVDSSSKAYGTALHLAAQHGQDDVVRVLLNANADVNALSTTKKQTPLQLAADADNESIVRLLLARGADPNHGRLHRALHAAAELGNMIAVHLLLEAGAEINALNTSGRTALHLAAARGHTAIAFMLITRRAALEIKDSVRGWTPLIHAIRHGHRDVVRLLINSGVEVMSLKALDSTPLHIAAQHGHAGIIRLLLQCGVPSGTRNKEGHTPEDLARMGGYFECAGMLLHTEAEESAEVTKQQEQLYNEKGIDVWRRKNSDASSTVTLTLSNDETSC